MKTNGLQTDLLAAGAPLPHEWRASAFEVYQIRLDLEHLRPIVSHVTDEGAPFWEVWFIHDNRPVILHLTMDAFDLQEFAEMLHRAVVAVREGSREPGIMAADLFAKRVREMLHGEKWVTLDPPTPESTR